MKNLLVYIMLSVTLVLQHVISFPESQLIHLRQNFGGTLGQDLPRKSKRDIEIMSEQDQPQIFRKMGGGMDVLQEDKILESLKDIDTSLLPPDSNKDLQQIPFQKHKPQFLNKNDHNLENIDESLLMSTKTRPSLQQKTDYKDNYNSGHAIEEMNYGGYPDNLQMGGKALNLDGSWDDMSEASNAVGGEPEGHDHVLKFIKQDMQEDTYSPKEWLSLRKISKKLNFDENGNHKKNVKYSKSYPNRYREIQNSNKLIHKTLPIAYRDNHDVIRRQADHTRFQQSTEKAEKSNENVNSKTTEADSENETFNTEYITTVVNSSITGRKLSLHLDTTTAISKSEQRSTEKNKFDDSPKPNLGEGNDITKPFNAKSSSSTVDTSSLTFDNITENVKAEKITKVKEKSKSSVIKRVKEKQTKKSKSTKSTSTTLDEDMTSFSIPGSLKPGFKLLENTLSTKNNDNDSTFPRDLKDSRTETLSHTENFTSSDDTDSSVFDTTVESFIKSKFNSSSLTLDITTKSSKVWEMSNFKKKSNSSVMKRVRPTVKLPKATKSTLASVTEDLVVSVSGSLRPESRFITKDKSSDFSLLNDLNETETLLDSENYTSSVDNDTDNSDSDSTTASFKGSKLSSSSFTSDTTAKSNKVGNTSNIRKKTNGSSMKRGKSKLNNKQSKFTKWTSTALSDDFMLVSETGSSITDNEVNSKNKSNDSSTVKQFNDSHIEKLSDIGNVTTLVYNDSSKFRVATVNSKNRDLSDRQTLKHKKQGKSNKGSNYKSNVLHATTESMYDDIDLEKTQSNMHVTYEYQISSDTNDLKAHNEESLITDVTDSSSISELYSNEKTSTSASERETFPDISATTSYFEGSIKSLETETIGLKANKSKPVYKINHMNATKANFSNVMKMDFDLDVPDTNFSLNIERKSVNDTDGNLVDLLNPNHIKKVQRNHRKRKDNRSKHNFYHKLVRIKRQLMFTTERIEEEFPKGIDSGEAVSDTQEISSQTVANTESSDIATKHKSYVDQTNTSPSTNSDFITKLQDDFLHNDLKAKLSANQNTVNKTPSAILNSNSVNRRENKNKSDLVNELYENDNENRSVLLKLVGELSREESKKMFKLMNLNASNLYNDSDVDGKKALYMLNVPESDNISVPRDIDIAKMLKSNVWDNVHYIEERDVVNRMEIHECCQNFFSLIKRNPFPVALSLAASCVVIVVMLIVVFLMAERKIKHNTKDSPASRRNSANYKIVRSKNQIAHGSVKRIPSKLEDPRVGGNESNQRTEAGKDLKDSGKNFEGAKKGRGKKNVEIDRGGQSVRREKPKNTIEVEGSPQNEKGIKNKAKRLTQWIRRKMSRVPSPDSESEEDKDSNEDYDESSDDYGRTSSTDKTYTSKRQRLMRFVKTRGGRKQLPKISQVEKVVAPDLRSTLREIKLHLSDDQLSHASQPAVASDLRERIVKTGDCTKIDNMLVKEDWEKSFYLAHGLDRVSELEDKAWMDHSPEERRKMDMDKITSVSGQSQGALGVLSKGSSSRSLKSAIQRSINTAEWVSKHPRPVANCDLKPK